MNSGGSFFREMLQWFRFASVLVFVAPAFAQYGDVTTQIERLGNPYADLYPDGELIYARNVWAVQAYEGRLYLSAGNSSNTGPAVNAGPLPIMSFDPVIDRFDVGLVVDDEQIDRYRVLDGRLYLPGHDPTQSWDWGNFYRLEDEGWVKYRNIPNGIHTYDMAHHDGLLFAALGVRGGAAVSVSDDDGQSWTNHPVAGWRVYAFLDFGHTLFASTAAVTIPDDDDRIAQIPEERLREFRERMGTLISEWRDGVFVARSDLAPGDLLPDTAVPRFTPGERVRTVKLQKPVTFGGAVVYIGALVHNGHQFLPLGLFAAHSLAPEDVRVQRLTPHPEAGNPWDLFERDGVLYVLTARPMADGGTTVQVWSTTDLAEWKRVLFFTAPTFARSFEFMDGAFYFGLGCEVEDGAEYALDELHPATGELLRFDTRQAADSRLIGGLTSADAFAGHLAGLLSDPCAAFRAAGRAVLLEFARLHDPERPRDRRVFLDRMHEVFRDVDGTDPALRQVAYGILLLHADYAGADAAHLLEQGRADPVPELRELATVIDAVRAVTPSGRALVRQLHARDAVQLRETAFMAPESDAVEWRPGRRIRERLRDTAFAELVQRPSPAFPEGTEEEHFEPMAALALPLEGWLFHYDRDGLGFYREWFRPDREMSEGIPIGIGAPWGEFLDEAYVGIGWYRTTVDVPAFEAVDALGLHFGAVDENAWVWIDGRYAGQQNIGPVGWDQPFQLDVTSRMEPGSTHEVIVRVRNTTGLGGIWKPVELRAYRLRQP